MKNKSRIPQLRFKGFEDEWELHPFCDIATRHSLMMYDENIPSVEYEDINSKKGTLNKDIFRKIVHKVGQHFVSGDILFGKLRPYLGNNLLADFEGVAVGDFWIFKQGLVNTRFLYPFLYSNYFSYISNISSGSKMPRSDWGLVSSWMFAIPMSDSEQSLIGELFNGIDKSIAEAEREVSRLGKMKIASLQKMFPRPGATTPEIRFAGFTEPWLERKISDCASFSRGYGYTKNHLRESGTPIFLYGRLYTKYSTYVDSVDTYSFVAPNSVISKGIEVVMPSSGETAEDIAVASAILAKGIILSGGLNIIIPNNDIDQIFLALSLTFSNAHYELAKKAQGKSVVHIYNQDIADLTISCPSLLPEQKAIGEYFRNLDTLISAKRKKLAKLRNIKQACLDKMFVNPSES